MEFIKPTVPQESIIAATYKISFDDKWFYIGSTKNVRRRMYKWRHMILRPTHPQLQINIKNILPDISCVRFEILNEYPNAELAKEAEKDLLVSYWNNEYILNICPNSEGSSGKDFKRRIKPVHQIDTDFKVVGVYKNHLLAAEYLNCTPQFMLRVLKGGAINNKCKLKGYIWKYA